MLGKFKVENPIVTVATACRNDGRGLWFTIHNILINTIDSKYEGRVKVAVVNNSDNPQERGYIKSLCEKLERFVDYSEVTDVYSNHVARNKAVSMSKTPYTILCDSHVIFGKNFMEETIAVLEQRPEVGIVHSPFCTMGILNGRRLACFYNLQKFTSNMHGPFSRYAADWEKPFPIAIAPHAAMTFRTKQWLDYGGYIKECNGHGGGEPYVTFKYWLFGSQVWCTPKTVYAHWRAAVSYRKSKGGWLQNMAVTAYALWGREVGDKYAEKLRCTRFRERLWDVAKPYHDFVQQRTNIKYHEFIDYLKKHKARPNS